MAYDFQVDEFFGLFRQLKIPDGQDFDGPLAVMHPVLESWEPANRHWAHLQ